MADLGRWLAEDYRVTGDSVAPEAGPDTDEVETD